MWLLKGRSLASRRDRTCQKYDAAVAGKGASGVYWSYDCGNRGDAKRVVSFCDRTDVEFYAMTEEEINGYLALEKEGEAPVWSDKAGGYGIQTVFGTKFVKGIQETIIM